jgi:hypothetical protein
MNMPKILITSALIGLALTTAPPASAERSWDIGRYDACMVVNNDVALCCVRSDGDLTQGQPPKCVAPPAQSADVSGGPLPTSTGRPRPPLNPGTQVG